ncbi:MAG: DNA recombination protein RmuC, partial [Akkermansia sp.]|nr:DNA recombination protein RmuC [Akkermansia sp.]
NIISRAELLYKKCATLDDSMEKVKRAIDTLSKSFEQARGQFKTGNGNLVRQIDELRNFGINPARRIAMDEVSDAPAEDARQISAS